MCVLGLTVNPVSASFVNPEPLPEDRAARFRWGFDLFGVYADQPGAFTFDGTEEGAVRSGALFVWMRSKDPTFDAVLDEKDPDFLENFTKSR